MNKTKPCKRCGEASPKLYKLVKCYFIACPKCKQCGRLKRTKHGAIRAWNKEVKQ